MHNVLCTSSCLFTCNVLQQKQRLVLGAGRVLCTIFFQWFCLQLHCIDFPYFLVRVDGWWKLAFGWCRHDLIPPQGDTPSVCTRSYCISYQGLCIMIFVTMNTSTSNTDPWIQTHNCSFLYIKSTLKRERKMEAFVWVSRYVLGVFSPPFKDCY